MEKWHLQLPWSRGLFRRSSAPLKIPIFGAPLKIKPRTMSSSASAQSLHPCQKWSMVSLKFQHGFSHSGSFHSVQLHKQHSYKSYHSCFGQHLPPSYVLELRRHMVNHPGDPQRCNRDKGTQDTHASLALHRHHRIPILLPTVAVTLPPVCQ